MEIEKKVVLKVKKDEQSYSFVCNESAPLGAIWDALQEMKNVILQQIQQQSVQNDPKDAEIEECKVQEEVSE